MSPPAKARAAAGERAPEATAAATTLADQLNMLAAERDAARIELADANRLLAEVKNQRNAQADEIMLLRAQLKVALEDGRAGWAAASASAPAG